MSSSYSIRFEKEDDKTVKYPARVERIMESYRLASKELSKSIGKKVSIQYVPSTEDYLELLFEKRLKDRSDSLKVHIYSIYRVKMQECIKPTSRTFRLSVWFPQKACLQTCLE